MRSIYIASRYSRKLEMREYAEKLRSLGIKVTSRWLQEVHGTDTTLDQLTYEFCFDTAETDLIDIEVADAFLFFAEDPLKGTPRGGRHVEFGFALANKIPIYVIGPRENIFHYLTAVKHYDSFDSFVEEQIEHLVRVRA